MKAVGRLWPRRSHGPRRTVASRDALQAKINDLRLYGHVEIVIAEHPDRPGRPMAAIVGRNKPCNSLIADALRRLALDFDRGCDCGCRS